MLTLSDLRDGRLPANQPVRLTDRLWWVGHLLPGDPFSCHAYLLEHGDESVLFNPGSARTIRHTLAKIAQVIPVDAIRWFVCPSARPEVAGALPVLDQLVRREDAHVVTTAAVAASLSHVGLALPLWLTEDHGAQLTLPDRVVRFVATPCLPDAFMSFDASSGTLLWGELAAPTAPTEAFEAVRTADLDAICAFQANSLAAPTALARLREALAALAVRRIAPRQGPLVPREHAAPLLARLWRTRAAATDVAEDPADSPTLAHQVYGHAVHDELTGLFTYQYMVDTVARWQRFQDRHAELMVSVILLDLDHLKVTNATFGDAGGDRALMHVAALMLQQCRDEDLAVRMRGNALALFLLGDNPDAAPSLASRIVAKTREATFDGALAALTLTLSAGTTCRTQGESMADVIHRAERALQVAKRGGRDQVETL